VKTFYNDCVSWPKNDVDCPGGLSDMVDNATDITRKTFLKHVNKTDITGLEAALGYSKHYKQGLTMGNDWHVSYCRSKLHNKIVYYFCHSAIEYVFI